MTKRRVSSAQDQWLRHSHITWRRAFPGFAALLDLALEVVGQETRLLALIAAVLIATTFSASLMAAFFSASWVNFESVELVEVWSLVAVALIGGWTSLGSRAWHGRFLCGSLTSGWLIAVHLAGPLAFGAMQGYSAERFSTEAISVFVLAAFGGAWISSIGRFALAGPQAHRQGLGRAQFGLATLLWTMLLVAAVLGLWQVTSGMEVRHWFHTREFPNWASLARLILPVGGGLLALGVGFGRWKAMLAACAAWLLLLLAADAFGVTRPAPLSHRAFVPGGASLGLALAVVCAARMSGLRRVNSRAESPAAATPPPEAA